MVSLPGDAKNINLAAGGYRKDSTGLFNETTNSGNIRRRAMFRTNENPDLGEYTGEEVLFLARLHHDFVSCSVSRHVHIKFLCKLNFLVFRKKFPQELESRL